MGSKIIISKETMLASLYKKALGYKVEEVVEEYSGEEKGGELLKRKVTTKPMPPDVMAIKAYLEIAEMKGGYKNMSDEELEKEKNRMLKELKGD